MLTASANRPIRPVPKLSCAIGGCLPTSPTIPELKRAFLRTVAVFAELVPLTMSVWGVDSQQATDQLQELDALIQTLGDPQTKMFFYHSSAGIESNYRVGFDNPKFNHALDPTGSWNEYKGFLEKRLFPEEVEILNLREVQTLLARYRDAIYQPQGEERLEQAEKLFTDLKLKLGNILGVKVVR